jgi:phage major head subunit gpT-like protein
MAAFKDDWGEPIGLMPDTIVCNQAMALPLANALIPSIAGTVRPEMAYVKNIVVSPWWDSDTDDWAVLCTTVEIKPIILQIRKEPEFVGKDSPQDEHVFMNKEFLYGVDGRCVAGYGEPRCAVRLHNT